jgi:predicted HicB family RNase H-like nuclease
MREGLKRLKRVKMSKRIWAKGRREPSHHNVRIKMETHQLAVEEAHRQKITIKEFVSHCINAEINRIRAK